MVMRSVRDMGKEFLRGQGVAGVINVLKRVKNQDASVTKPFEMFSIACAAVYVMEEVDHRIAYDQGAVNFIFEILPRFSTTDLHLAACRPQFYTLVMGALFHTYGKFDHVSTHEDFYEVSDDNMFRMIIKELEPFSPALSRCGRFYVAGRTACTTFTHYNALRIMVTHAKRIASRACVSEVIEYISVLVRVKEMDENVQVGYTAAALAVCPPSSFLLSDLFPLISSECAALRAHRAGGHRWRYARPP